MAASFDASSGPPVLIPPVKVDRVLQSADTRALDRIADLAVHLLDAAAAVVAFADGDRQWHASIRGPASDAIPEAVPVRSSACARVHGFDPCAQTHHLPVTAGDLKIKCSNGEEPPASSLLGARLDVPLYAGVPLRTGSGDSVGLLGTLSGSQTVPTAPRQRMRDLAELVVRDVRHCCRQHGRRIWTATVHRLADTPVDASDAPSPRRPMFGPDVRMKGVRTGAPARPGQAAPRSERSGNDDRIPARTPPGRRHSATERTEGGQPLAGSRERYRALVDNFPNGGVFLFGDDLRYRLAGGSELSAVGLSSEDVEGHRPRDLFPKEIAAETEDSYRAALRGEKRVFEQTYRGQRYRIQTVPVYGDDGEVLCGMALSQNVTEEKAREDALIKARARAEARQEILDTVFANAPILFLVFGADGTLQQTNAVWKQRFGWEEGDIETIGDLLPLVFPDATVRATVRSFIDDPPGRWRTFQSWTRENGPIDSRWTFVRLSDGRRIGVGIDVTEREEVQRALRQERDRLATLFHSLPTPVVHGVPDGDRFIVRTVNTAFEQVFDVQAEALRGQDLHDVIVPADLRDEAAAINRRVIEEPSLQTEVERQANGRRRPFRVQAAVQESDDGPAEAYAIYTDVTDQKKQEARLREAKQQAEEAARLKSAMLANMSHEIRTPLTAVTGFSEILADDLEGERARFARLIRRNSDRLMRTLDSVLQLSKLDAGAYELETSRIDLAPHLREVADMMQPKADSASVSVSVHLPDHPVVCEADAHAVERIATNLLGNAIKFTEAGGQVQLRAYLDAQRAVIEVEDTGIGISDAFRPHLFEAFQQESQGLRRTHEGTGLGLAITQRLVHAIDGRIQVDSEPGEGTCVTVDIPTGAR
jgi:PAS domain S-box-containing protein